jgi:hypothetical protein
LNEEIVMPGMPMSTKAGGVCLGVPDVCKVPAPPAPPVPTPFPNTGQVAAVVGFSPNVTVENKPVVVEGCKIPNSSGDEAGVAGGVVSGTNLGPVEYKVFSSKVFVAGKKVAMLTSTTAHNGSNANTVGAQIAPSQALVIAAL